MQKVAVNDRRIKEMNKIYKVIWSKAKGCYVVVSEIANQNGKSKSSLVNAGMKLSAAVMLALSAALLPLPGMVSEAAVAIENNDNGTVNKGSATASGARAIAVGAGSKSTTQDSIAIGTNANGGNGTGVIAVGWSSNASATDTVAIGSSSSASSGYAVAMGQASSASGKDSMALGHSASASETGAVALGNGAKATSTNALSFGSNSVSAGINSVSLGTAASAKGRSDISIGSDAQSTSTGGETQGSIAIGTASRATGDQAVALGAASRALKEQSTAIGNDSFASATGAIVIGGDDTKDVYKIADSVAAAYGFVRSDKDFDPTSTHKYRASVASGVGAVTVGVSGQAISQGSTAIGVMATAGDGGKTIIGTSDDASALTDEITTQNIEATAIGAMSHAQSQYSTAIGRESEALGQEATAIGSATSARGQESTAIGNGAVAQNIRDIAIGTNVSAQGANNYGNQQVPSIAIGYDAHVTADESVAIGNKNTISGKDKNGNTLTGVNIQGHNNTVNASGVQIVGNNNKVTDKNLDDVFILGNDITAGARNSVYLGSGSSYMAEGTSSAGTSKNYTSETIGGKTLSFAGGNATAGVVTVGSASATRRIQGVAPGKLSATSTDAVNGSQLYAAVSSFAAASPHYYSVADPNASDGNYNNDGAKGTDSMAAGKNTTAWGNNSTAIGKGAQTGHQYPNNGQENATNATALGTNAKAYSKESIAIGDGATTGSMYDTSKTEGQVALGQNAQATATHAIAIGSASSANAGTKAQSESAIVIGDGASTSANAGVNNTVIGTKASSKGGANNIVMGTGASNESGNGAAIVLGNSAQVGMGAKANAIAIGSSSKVDGGGMAIGNGAHVTNSSATHGGSIAIGDMSEVSSAGGGIAIGKEAKSTNSTGPEGGAIALGQKAVSNGVQSMAIGYNAHNRDAQTGQIALGANATTYGENSIAIGRDAKTEDNNSGQLALGYNAAVKYGGGIALGSNSVANRTKDVPDAYNPYRANDSKVAATKATTSALSIGSDGGGGTTKVLRQITNVAAGGADTDAVNVAQLKAVAADISASSSQNFTVGADSSHSTDGVNVTKDNNRFDITSKDEGYLTTGVSSDKKGIEIGLSDAAKQAIDQVAGNTSAIAKNRDNITANTSSISALSDTVKAGWEADVNGTKVKDVTPESRKLNFKNGQNISITGSGDDITVATADELTAAKVTTGNTVMNTDGVQVGDSVSLTSSGLDNGGNQITDVKSGIEGARDAEGNTATVATAAGDTLTHAANIGDVQSAMADVSWTAEQNGVSAGTIKNGGAVNFANGAATTASVTSDANGTKVVYDLNAEARESLTKADSALQSFQTSANDTAAQTIDAANNKANFTQGDNIVLTPSSEGIQIATAKNVNFNSVGAGTVTVGTGYLGTALTTVSSRKADGSEGKALSVAGSKITNLEAGTEATDAVNVSQLNAVRTHFYSVGSTTASDDNYNNDGATGIDALAVGVGASASGTSASAVGNKASASGLNASAFGANAKANGDHSAAIGDGAIANGENAIAIGNGARTAEEGVTNGIAIGQGARAEASSSVALGSGAVAHEAVGTSSYEIGGSERTFAGANPSGTVSIGTENDQRTITNVAAGRISATSTDAVNGSQLYQTVSAVNENHEAITTLQNGWTLAASAKTGTTGTASGSSHAIKAGDTATLEAGNNVALTQNGSKVTIATSMTPSFTSVTVPNGSSAAGTSDIVISGSGISAGGKTITGVAAGVNDTDAVNKGQLISTIAERIPQFGDGKNTTLGMTKTEDGIEHRRVDLNDHITLGSTDTETNKAKAVDIDGTVGTLTAGTGDKAVSLNGTTGTIQSGKVTVNGTAGTVNNLTNRTWNVKTSTPVDGQAATENQLKSVSDAVNANSSSLSDLNTAVEGGLSFVGDDNKSIKKQLGGTLTIKGGRTTDLADNNIGVVSDTDGALHVKLAKTLSGLTSVVAGNTTMDTSGVIIKGSAEDGSKDVKLTASGLSNGGNVISNVASGGTTGTNAANINDVKAAVGAAAWAAQGNGTRVNDVKHGSAVNFANGTGTTATVARSGDGSTTTVTYGLNAASTASLGRADTALQSIQTAVESHTAQTLTREEGKNVANFKMGKNISLSGDSTGITIATADDLTAKSVTIGEGDAATKLTAATSGGAPALDVGGNKVTNVADGTESSDAVNKGQLDQAVAENAYSWSVSDGTASKVVARNGKVSIIGSANGVSASGSGIVTKLNSAGDVVGVDLSEKTKSDINKGVAASSDIAEKGLTFKAKDDSTTNIEKLGSTVTVTGDSNITTTAAGDMLTVGLSKDLTGISSVSNGGTTVTLSTDADGKHTVDMGGAQVTGVASGGTTETNAANIGDVNQAKTELTDKGLSFTGNDGGAVSRKLGETLSVKGGITNFTGDVSTQNIGVKKNTAGDGLDIYMSEKPVFTEVTAGEGENQTVIGSDGVTVGGRTYITKEGLDANRQKVTNVADGTKEKDAVNYGQLTRTAEEAVKEATDKGLHFEGDTGAVIDKKLGETLAVRGGVTDTSTLTSGNIGVVSEGGALQVRLSKDLSGLTSVTAGDTTMETGGITVRGSAADGTKNVTLGKSGLDNGGNTITNVAPGTLSDTSTDAVNGSQLYEVKTQSDANAGDISTLKGGWYINSGEDGGTAEGSAKTAVKAGDTVKVNAGKNLSLKQANAAGETDLTLSLADRVTLGNGANSITIDGTQGTISMKDAADATSLTLDGKTGNAYLGGEPANANIKLYGASGNATFGNVAVSNDNGTSEIKGLSNRTIGGEGFATAGRAATEEQLQLAMQNMSGTIETSATRMANGTNTTVSGQGTTADPFKVSVNSDLVNMDSATFRTNGDSRVLTDGTGIYVTDKNNIDENTHSVINASGDQVVSLTATGINAGSEKVTHVASDIDDETGTDFAAKLSNAVANNPGSAVNVSDLGSAVESVKTSGLDFVGNDGSSVHRDLGATLSVKGGLSDVSAGVSDRNLGVKENDAGDGLTVVMSENPEFTSVTAGNTAMTSSGITISREGNPVSLTTSGLNNGGNKITGVAKGEADTDAVNVKQLNDTINEKNPRFEDGKNTTFGYTTDPKTGAQTRHVDLNDHITLGDASTPEGKAKAVSIDGTAGQIAAGDKVVIDGTTGNIKAGTVTVNGSGTVNDLSNRTWDINNPTVVSGQAATEDQLKTVSDAAKTNTDVLSKGLSFKGDDSTVINKKLGETMDIRGGASSDLTDGNIGVVSDNGALHVKLSKDIRLGDTGSVTTGGTTVNNGGVTVKGGAADGSEDVKLTSSGLDNGGNIIRNVASGGTTGTNAANINDVRAAVNDASWTVKNNSAVAVNTVKNGSAVQFVNGEGTEASAVKADDTTTTVSYGLNAASRESLAKADSALQSITTAVNGATAQTLSGSNTQANFKAGNNISLAGDTTGITIATQEDVSFQTVSASESMTIGDDTNGKTTLTTTKSEGSSALNVGGNKITNVANGTADSDAVNVKQLKDRIAESAYNWNVSDGVVAKDVPDNTTVTVKGSANGKSATDAGIITHLNEGNVLDVDLSKKTKDDIAKGTQAADDISSKGLIFKAKDNTTTNEETLGKTVTVTGDDNVTTKASGDILTVGLSSALTGISSVANGDTKITLAVDAGGNHTVDMGGAQITGVKSGGNVDSNAANISDVKKALSDAGMAATGKGMDFLGNDGETNTIHRDLGTTLKVQGSLSDVSTGVSGKNLGVKKNIAGDGLTLVMTENPEFNTVTAGTVTNTKVTMGDSGVKVGEKTYVDKDGLHANGNKVTNVAEGNITEADSKDAVNGGQLYTTNQNVANNTTAITKQGDRITTLEGGFYVTAGNDTATGSNIKAGDTVNFAAKDGNTTVTTTKDSKTITIGMSKTPTLDGVTVTNTSSAAGAGDVIINGDGINAGNKPVTNVADGKVAAGSKDAVNGGQLYELQTKADTNAENISANTSDISANAGDISQLKKTWNLDIAADGGSVNGDHAKTNVASDATVTMKAGKNIALTQSGTAITVATSMTPAFDRVVVGNDTDTTTKMVLSKTGLKVGDTTYISKDGLNAGKQKITDVADGVKDTDAVNKGQLDEAKTHYFSVNSEETGDLSNYDNDGAEKGGVAAGANAVAGAKAASIGYNAYAKENGVAVGKDALANAIGGIAIGDTSLVGGRSENSIAIGKGAQALDRDSVALGSGAVAENVTSTPSMTVNGNTRQLAGSTAKGTVSIGSEDNERTITNLAAGRVSETSTDAVNGSQLYAVAEETGKGLKFGANSGETVTNKLGSEVDVKGSGNKEDSAYSGANLKTRVSQDGNGNTTINVLMDRNASFDTVTAGTTEKSKVVIGDNAVTLGGKTYITSEGLDANGQKITNVANGKIEKDSKDAVNGGQLWNAIDGISESASGGFGFTDDGETKVQQDLGKQIRLTGKDGITVTGDADGKVMTFGLSDKVSVGASGENGKDGSLTVSGKDGFSVTVNGKDGSIGLKGADGADGTPGTAISVKGQKGDAGIDGKDGMSRLVVDDHQVATLDDGVKYSGDSGSAAIRLNKTAAIIGGADTESLSDDNIGVIAFQAEDNAKLTVKLAKVLKGLSSVETVSSSDDGAVTKTVTDGNGTKVTKTEKGKDGADTVISETAVTSGGVTITKKGDGTDENPDTTVSLTGNGLNNGGNKITNVADGTIAEGSKDAVNGGQIYNLQQTVAGGLSFEGDTKEADAAANTFARRMGETTRIVGGITDPSQLSDGNIGVVSNGSDTLTVKLAKDITDIHSIIMDESGTGLNPVTGVNSRPAKVTLSGQGLRIVPKESLNEDGTEKTDAASKRKIVTINADGNNSINAGELYITNVKSAINDQAVGTDGTFTDKLEKSAADENLRNNAVNVSDLHNLAKDLTAEYGKGNFGLKDGEGKEVRESLGKTVQVIGDGRIDTSVVDVNTEDGEGNVVTSKALKVSLSDTLSVGKAGKDGKDGADGSIAVNGKNGSTGVSITAEGGEDGENGADGRIVLSGKDGANVTEAGDPRQQAYETISIRTERGQKGADGAIGRPGVDGRDFSRIVYYDGSVDHTVATLDDGMKYGGDAESAGNDKKVISKKLNQQVNVIGGISDETKLTGTDNLGVVSDGENNLKVRLAKDLTGLTSVTTGGTTVNNGGVTVKGGAAGGSEDVKLTSSGLDNGGNRIVRVKSGLDGAKDKDGKEATLATATGDTLTNAANIGDLQKAVNEAAEGVSGSLTDKGLKFGANSGETVTNKLGSEVDVKGGGAKEDSAYSGANLKTRVSQDGNGNTTINILMDRNASFDSVTAGNTVMNTSGLTIKGKDEASTVSLTDKGLSAGEKQITHMGSGIDGKTYGEDGYNNGASIGDVHTIVNEAAMASGTKVTVKDDGSGNVKVTESADKKTYTVGLSDTVTIGSTDGKKVTVDGTKGTVGGLTNKTWNPDDITSGQAATEDQLKAVSEEVSKAAKPVSVTGGNNIRVEKSSNADGTAEYKVSTAEDLSARSVTIGSGSHTTKIQTVSGTAPDGSSVSALDVGGSQITGVADGKVEKGSKDAVNGGQLAMRDAAIINNANAINAVAGQVGELHRDISETGAMSAALAGLKPLQYDPLEPTQIMAGFGHYRDENAVALGVAHYTNESTMFHIGASVGRGEHMYNAGVTWKVGSRSAEKAVPDKYRAGPISSVYVLQDEVRALQEENKALRDHAEKVEKDNREMKEKIDLLMKAVGLSQ